jgi:Ca2+-binding RTX toxin-like protein
MNRTHRTAGLMLATATALAALVANGSEATAQPAETPTLICQGQVVTIVGTPGDDRITGTAGADVIMTVGGDDIVFAGAGDDVVCAGDGADTVHGGAGSDLLRGEAGADRLWT